MITFFDIFSSKSKIMILRTLYFQTRPIHLRQIAHISGLPIFSVQQTLKNILKDNILEKSRHGNNVLFKINMHHPFYNFLSNVISFEMQNSLCQRALKYHNKAVAALSFASNSIAFFQNIKGN